MNQLFRLLWSITWKLSHSSLAALSGGREKAVVSSKQAETERAGCFPARSHVQWVECIGACCGLCLVLFLSCSSSLAHISHPADVMGVSLLETFRTMLSVGMGVGGDERKSPTPNSAHVGNEVVCTPCERFLQHRAGRVAMLTNSLQQHFSAGLLIPTEYWLTSCC